jgi:hypothetical protein
VQQSQLLQPYLHAQVGHARKVAARSVQAGDKSKRDRVEPKLEDDRNCRGRGLGRKCRGCAGRGNHGDLSANQLGRQRRQPLVLPLRPAVFDRDAFALDTTGFLQALTERGHHVRVRLGRRAAQESDHRHGRLLRAGSERPCRRAAEQSDELTSLHSITSSARSGNAGGMCKPIALAVLRLITSSNLVGA